MRLAWLRRRIRQLGQTRASPKQPPLSNSIERTHRIWKIHWIMLPLPHFDQRDEYIQAIALGRAALRGHKTLDIVRALGPAFSQKTH